MVILAAYKGKGNLGDKLIRAFTNSPYSHCEILIDKSIYSSSQYENSVRKTRINTPSNWDYIIIPDVNKNDVLKFYEETKGNFYDYVAILFSYMIPLGLHINNWWVCSEWCHEALKRSGVKLSAKSNSVDPGELVDSLLSIGYDLIQYDTDCYFKYILPELGLDNE